MANHSFCGAAWRVRRRLPKGMRPALDVARAAVSASLASRMGAHVVIAGGGFGGLYAARRLERRLPRHSARITLVSDVNFLLYTPLLPGPARARWSRATWWCPCARSLTGPTSGSHA